MLHSTGCNNTSVERYASVTGWNRPEVLKSVHGFIGTSPDWNGVGIVQTLPWTHRAWHCGTGTKGTANSTHIGIEVCEDDLKNAVYFWQCVDVAVKLFAYLCKKFYLNPLEDGVIISHKEGHARGVASNHGDIDHWFKIYKYSMNQFRLDVANEMKGESDEMTQEKFNEMAENWQNERAKRAMSEWAVMISLDEWNKKNNLSSSNSGMQKFLTKEEVLAIVKRVVELITGGI